MIKIGLTGNIGSGKSTVARIFEILGVPVFYADLEAKKILERKNIQDQIKKYFGDGIIDKNNTINRKLLASLIFKDKVSLNFLNNLIHPEVSKAFDSWLKKQLNSPYIIHEAAILFESGFDQFMDKIVYVYAPKHLRIKRIIRRDKLGEQEINQRIKNQWSDKQKMEKSDYVIVNGNNDLLIPQVLKIHKLYESKISIINI